MLAVVCNDNIDWACAVIEQTAIDKANIVRTLIFRSLVVKFIILSLSLSCSFFLKKRLLTKRLRRNIKRVRTIADRFDRNIIFKIIKNCY